MKNKNGKDKATMPTREVAVLIEDLRSQFRIFGEDLSAVKKKVDAIFEEQGKQKEDIFIIKTDIRIIKADIAEIKEIRLVKIEEDIRVIKEDFGKRLTVLETTRSK